MCLYYSCGILKDFKRCFLFLGDVLGFFIDLERGKVFFLLNGNVIERDFKVVFLG